jgi:hypothetical protein
MINYAVKYVMESKLPRLGWIAIVDTEKHTVKAIHGENVEYRKDWMVEGVWDDDFVKGDFHKTEVFFGSGMRVTDNKIYFVSSTSLSDRILFCQEDKKIMVSNSLLLLLGYTASRLDVNHDYREESESVKEKGIKAYDRDFRIIHPTIKQFKQVFFENIVIEDNKINFEFKSQKKVKIKTYEEYYELLLKELNALKENYQSRHRKTKIKPYSTISSGYDSTAVSVLVKKIGVNECFSGNRINGVIRRAKKEVGCEIAKRLGYKKVNVLEINRKRISKDELYFLSTNYPKFSKSVWCEISLHSMVKAIELKGSASVVFTGYRGHIWDAESDEKYQQGDLKSHGAIGGLNLTEVRLKAGFFNVAVPYIFATRSKEIFEISKSPEMSYWKLNKPYDRPIPRRIVEDSGVDRYFFGINKQHITTTYMWPMNKQNRKLFFKYLNQAYSISRLYTIIYYLQKKILCDILKRRKVFGRNIDYYYIMREWATELLRKEYGDILYKYSEKQI